MEKMEIVSRTVMDVTGSLLFDVTIHKQDEVLHKVMAAEDYLSMFSESMVRNEQYVPIIRLPESVIWAQACTEHPDSFQAAVYMPAARRPFIFMGNQMTVPFPALVMVVTVRGGERVESRLFAVKEKPADLMSAVFYNYPYGNVSKDSGRCCFGNISVNGLQDASQAPVVMDMFLYGETNNDLWGEGRVLGYRTQGDLLEDVKKMEVFPVERLTEAGTCFKTLIH